MKFCIGSLLVLANMAPCVHAQTIPAGNAPIQRALAQIVPAPFEATIDARIPEGTVLRWNASPDWMRALRDATGSAGLRVLPNFEAGRIEVLPGLPPVAKPIPTAAAASVPQPVAPLATPEIKLVPPLPAMAPVIAPAVVTVAIQAPKDIPISPAPAATPARPVFVLKPGTRIDAQFTEWAKRDGWSLLWTSERSWVLPGTSTVTYQGPVDMAIESAIKDLYGNGVPVRLDIWEANKVMEITHAK